MKSYEVITPLRRDGEKVPAGGIVELADKEAGPLLAKQAIALSRPTRAAAPAKSEPAAPAKSAGKSTDKAG